MAAPSRRRIVFFGTSEFAVPLLEALANEPSIALSLVVTTPDAPAGRSAVLKAPPVKRAAERLGLTVFQPASLKGASAKERLREAGAEAFVVASYGKILPKEILEIPPRGSVNVHPSFLPRHRGASPIRWAILEGDRTTGVTVMLMNERMDEGPILARSAPVAVDGDETAETLTTKLSEAAVSVLLPALRDHLDGRLVPEPQDDAEATYTKVLVREDGRIDWNRPCEEIERMIRALAPWPGTFTEWTKAGRALKLLVKRASVMHPTAGCGPGLVPGRVSKLSDGGMAVDCGRGCLRLERVQLEGRQETDGAAFLNGHQDASGSVLGAA